MYSSIVQWFMMYTIPPNRMSLSEMHEPMMQCRVCNAAEAAGQGGTWIGEGVAWQGAC